MPLQLEPIVILATVTMPSEIVAPVVVAVGGAFAAMARGMQVMYNNGRKDTISAVEALKDSSHALDKVTASNDKQATAIERLTIIIQEDRYKRASGG